jgi:hypothetical protein
MRAVGRHGFSVILSKTPIFLGSNGGTHLDAFCHINVRWCVEG